jgi:hypothetical protein
MVVMRVGSSSLVGSTALALVLGMVLAVVAWNHVRSTADELPPPSSSSDFDPTKEGGEEEDPPKNLTGNNAGTVSFPWEPSRTTSTTTMMTPGNAMQQQQQQRKNDSRNKFQQEQQQELHFLASMSFANGGLRTPTCRCCQ